MSATDSSATSSGSSLEHAVRQRGVKNKHKSNSHSKKKKRSAPSDSDSTHTNSSDSDTSSSDSDGAHVHSCTPHGALAMLGDMRTRASVTWLAEALHACEESILRTMLREHRAARPTTAEPDARSVRGVSAPQPQPPPRAEGAAAHPSEAAAAPAPGSQPQRRRGASTRTPRTAPARGRGTSKVRRATWTPVLVTALQVELANAEKALKPVDFDKLARKMGFTPDQLKRKVAKLKKVGDSPSPSMPTGHQTGSSGRGLAGAAAAAAAGSLFEAGPGSQPYMQAQHQQQPHCQVARQLLLLPAPPAAPGAVAAAPPSQQGRPMGSPRAAQRKQARPRTPPPASPSQRARRQQVQVQQAHQQTPLRQKVQDILALVPGRKGTVGAVVEELMLYDPWSDMDTKALKKQVATIMSSGEEFMNTTQHQSKENKRFEYVLQPDKAKTVKIKGRKER